MPPTTYAYTEYKRAPKKDTLFMHPIHTYQECKIAQQHNLSISSESDFKPIEYYMNKQYTGTGLNTIDDDEKNFGCILHGDAVVFNEHPRAKLDVDDNSVVKILMYTPIEDIVEYPRYVNVKPIKSDNSDMHQSTKDNLNNASVQSLSLIHI